MNPIGFDPSYNSSSIGDFTLGALYSDGAKLYRFVKTTDAVAMTNGMISELASATTWTVTPDRSGGSSLGRIPAGVHVGAVSAGNYCFLLIDGFHDHVYNTGDVLNTVGQKVALHATVDGSAKLATAYTDWMIGAVVTVSSGGYAGVKVAIEV